MARTPVWVGINQPPEHILIRKERLLGNEIPFRYLPRADTGGQGDRHITLTGDDMNLVVYFRDDAVSAHKALVGEVGFTCRNH